MLCMRTIAVLLVVCIGCQGDPPQVAEDPTGDGPTADTATAEKKTPPRDQPKAISKCVATFYPQAESDKPEAKVRRALARGISLEFQGAALRDVLDWISETAEFPIKFEREASKQSGAGSIDIHLKDITLRSALRNMLAPEGLAYFVDDGVLRIVTQEVAESQLVTRTYDVQALDAAPPKRDDPYSNDLTVAQLIEVCVEPSSWDVVGGPGTMKEKGDTLSIRCTQESHREIARLLAQLCRVVHDEIAPDTRVLYVTEPAADFPCDRLEARNIAAIQSALDRETTFRLGGLLLSDLDRTIQESHGIQVRVDWPAIDETGLSYTHRVFCSVSGVTLRSALRCALEKHYLTFFIHNEVLLITSQEEAEVHQVTRLYPVGDLLETAEKSLSAKLLDKTDAPQPDFESLRTLVQTTVSPSEWDDVGGPGSIAYYRPAKCLIVSQSSAVHAEVAALFAKLRDSLLEHPAPPSVAQPIPPDRVMTLTYVLSNDANLDGDAGGVVGTGPFGSLTKWEKEQLAEIDKVPAIPSTVLVQRIQKQITPGSWRDERFKIDTTLPGQLLICQTYAVHKQIARFLDDLKQFRAPGLDPIRDAEAPPHFIRGLHGGGNRGGSYIFEHFGP